MIDFRRVRRGKAVVTDTVLINALDQEGRGIARIDGKAVFVEGALAGELVTIEIHRRRPTYELARATAILRASPSRVAPLCPHFGVCGGCSLQHLEAAAQVAAKQRVLEDALWHIGRVRAGELLAPIHGPAWGYRQRARLSVRDVPKKGGVLVGFHERKSSFITDMRTCPVLPPHISSLLPALRELIGGLSLRDRLPQIELAVGDDADDGSGNEVLVLRNLAALTVADEHALTDFADRHGVRLYLQPQGPATAQAFHPPARPLGYALPDFGVRIEFQPTDFTQVNVAMNRMLVRRAVGLLEPREGDAVADFFCGLGNFSLPIARRGANIVGIEGSAPLVRRAQANAQANGLANRARFVAADLFEATRSSIEALGSIDKALLDPPREGAIALVKALPEARLARVVYVSCNPATLARDASVLVHERGFTLRQAGIVNLFPHTAHVESVALFTR